MKKLLALGVLGMFGVATGAHAAAITGVTATASSEFAGLDRGAVHTTDGSGQFPNGTTSNVADGTMWLSEGLGAYGESIDRNPTITFNLGSVNNIGEIDVWNYNEAGNTARGVASASILTSIDGVNFSLLPLGIALSQASGTVSNIEQTFAISATAQYVEFTNLGSFTGDDDGLKGLSEVQFVKAASVAPVSEPASFAVLGIGLIGMFFARKSLSA